MGKKGFILSAVFIIIAGAFYFSTTEKLIDKERKVLRLKVIYKWPEVKDQPVAAQDLPENLKTLAQTLTKPKLESVVFTDGKRGWRLTEAEPQPECPKFPESIENMERKNFVPFRYLTYYEFSSQNAEIKAETRLESATCQVEAFLLIYK